MWLSFLCWSFLQLSIQTLAIVLPTRPNPQHPANGHVTSSPHRRLVASYLSSPSESSNLENIPGRYVATIQLNGRDFRVAVDTGSADLWLVTTPDFQFDTNGSIPVELNYDGGPVSGITGFAEMVFGDYRVPSQVFLNATHVELDYILSLGLDGLFGIGFGTYGNAVSELGTQLVDAGFPAAAVQPFIFNVFDQTPTQNNFMTIGLSRTDDIEHSVTAEFTINELDPAFIDQVNAAAELPLFPPGNDRWSVVVDSMKVDGMQIPIRSAVPGAPEGSFVAFLDTGTISGTVPIEILYAIYSQIPGAIVDTQNEDMYFIIPCDTNSILTFEIGGVEYPVHPLDLSYLDWVMDLDGNNFTACVSSLYAQPANEEMDVIFGDSILRNMYSVFNFGNSVADSPTGDATVKIVSTIDSVADVQRSVASVRQASVAKLTPPLLQPGIIPSGFQAATPGSTMPELFSDTSQMSDENTDGEPLRGAVATENTNANPSAIPTTSGSHASLKKCNQLIIVLVGTNLIMVAILAVTGVALYLRRGGTIGTVRLAFLFRRPPQYAPVRLREDERLRFGQGKISFGDYEHGRYAD